MVPLLGIAKKIIWLIPRAEVNCSQCVTHLQTGRYNSKLTMLCTCMFMKLLWCFLGGEGHRYDTSIIDLMCNCHRYYSYVCTCQ